MRKCYKDKAILLLIFNRPDTTKEVMQVLQQMRPSRLYIAADGARTNKEGEAELCSQTRAISLQMIDWECDVRTLFRETNLGCAISVSGGIDWFFEHEEMGIILEDDCVPDPTFYTFCSFMLDFFLNDERVMHISGFRDFDDDEYNTSYFFSNYPRIWGWATWRRAWKQFDLNPPKPTPELISRIVSTCFYGHRNAGHRWFSDFEKSYSRLSSWDYQWCLSIWKHHGLCVNSSTPLVRNIGFDDRGTHTTDRESASDLRAIRLGSFSEPVAHPVNNLPNRVKDVRSFERHLYPNLIKRVQLKWSHLKRFIRKRAYV